MKQNTRSFYLLVEVLLLLLRAAAAVHNVSTEAERGITFYFLVAALLLLVTLREGCAEKIYILVFGFCLIRVRNQSRCDSVCTAALSRSTRFLLPSSLPSCLYVCVLLSTKRHVMLNLTSAAAVAAAAAAAATALRTAGWSCAVFFSFSSSSLAKAT